MEGNFLDSQLFQENSHRLIGALKLGWNEFLFLGEIYSDFFPGSFFSCFFFLKVLEWIFPSSSGRVGEQEKIDPYPSFLPL